MKLYTDWLLNKSIAKQFNAFKKGFDLVMGESNLADLFTAREVELLICGDQVRKVNLQKFEHSYQFMMPTLKMILFF